MKKSSSLFGIILIAATLACVGARAETSDDEFLPAPPDHMEGLSDTGMSDYVVEPQSAPQYKNSEDSSKELPKSATDTGVHMED